MAGKNETPRQKMIGMMYLVLTALLAMNVSKEVLMGFVTVNESLERSNKTFNESTGTMMKYFADYIKNNQNEKYYYTKAEDAEKISGDMYAYIETLKKKLVEITEKRNKQQADTSRLRYVNALDNYDIPTFEMFGSNESSPTKGSFSAYELRTKLTETHDKISKLFDGEEIKKKFLPSDIEIIKRKISNIKPVDPEFTQNGVKEDWQMANFYHLPLAAVITNLSKIQADLKNAESETINTIAKSVMTTIPKIDQFAAAVVSPTNYIQVGEKYQSQIFLAAGSSNVKREIFIGDFDTTTQTFRGESQQLAIDANGRALFEQTGGAQGERSYKGVIKMTKETGEVKYYPFEQKYIVAPTSVAVSSDNMNVIYAGIDNPVTVSAAGIAPKDLRVTLENGTITTNASGKFTIKVMSGRESIVKVSAQTENGIKKQGDVKFRIKNLPAPTLKLMGKGNGDNKITKGEIAVSSFINAAPEGFIMALSYKVKNFTMTVVSGGKGTVLSADGGKITPEMKTQIARSNPNSTIVIEANVVSPDEKTHQVTTVLKLK